MRPSLDDMLSELGPPAIPSSSRRTNGHSRTEKTRSLMERAFRKFINGRRVPISGVWRDPTGRLRIFSYRKSWLLTACNKAVRRYKEELSNGSSYKKVMNYHNLCY